ncbi:MAG: hypothetical protein K5654_00820 [Lachnospiraceae bacterium]|nr:hypothetical protein [Lachnospiraceae bacterium]
MRVTNKIMQSNTLYNINQNKLLQDKLNTQITTRKKVNKPSEDPVIAIRALRLRSNLDQVTQYYDRNIPDADQWLKITEAAIDTTVDVISGMIDECRRGSKGSLTSSDRKTILESLKQYRDEVYATGDSDYAGRTLFTGYRTDMKLSFQNPESKQFTITEQLNNLAVDSKIYVDSGNLNTVNETTYNSGSITTEQEVVKTNVNRIRLAYDNLDSGVTPKIYQTIGYTADGSPQRQALLTPTVVSKDSTPDPYRVVSDPSFSGYDADACYFIPETGEILLGKNAFDQVMNLAPETEITVEYSKTEWASGDLNPIHYYACESDGVEYNMSYLTEFGKDTKQEINYDVGFNQTINVNTTCDEIFDPGIRRTVDEMIGMLDEIGQLDGVLTKLKSMQGNSAYNQDAVTADIEAVEKAQAYLTDTIQKRFERGITDFQGYLDQANEALTAVGNRSLRLELVENRLNSQMQSFTELTSLNEDADLAELAIRLKSAELTYDASLASTGKMLSTTLLNYL